MAVDTEVQELVNLEALEALQNLGPFIVISADDLAKFGVKVAIWSAVGAGAAIALGVWMDATEDERKERRLERKRAKAWKEHKRIVDLQAKKEAKQEAKVFT